MNDFKENVEMERLLIAKQNQPDIFAQIPATTKMSVGIYESGKPTTNELSEAELLRLRGLKQSITEQNLTPSERTSLALEIFRMEKNNDTNK
jgi:hypothetical protein